MTAVRTSQRTSIRGSSAAPSRAPGGRPSTTPRLTLAQVPVRRSGNRLLLVAAGVVLVVAVLAISVSQALQVQTQDRLDELQGQIVVQQQLAEAQRLELAELQSPERIVDTATERLGMLPPDEIVYLRSDPGDDSLIAMPQAEAGDTPVVPGPMPGVDE
jgi:cell division protein FtsL